MSSTATWEEIKRLAADFQRVQLVESSYKLSERNCIEIVNKLIEMGMISVLHSIDGKEFITLKQIEKEIYDELYVHEGRINIVKLQTLLNVDITHIETKVSEIVKSDPDLVLILGQIISKDYMNKISEEINELLQERGSVSIAELTNLYELPSDFIYQVVKPRVGTIIKGNFDGKILYTINYVNTQKALLSGILEASIKPIRFSQIIKEYNLECSMVFEIFDELISTGQISGSLFGGRQEMSAVFVPSIYTKAQQQYVESFFKQNGFIDYSSLKKIGITEPDNYVKSIFKDQTHKYLSASCFASYYLDQIESEIEDGLNRNGYIDLSQSLPPSLNSKDIGALTSFFQTKLKSNIDSIVMADTYLINKKFLSTLNSKFQAQMEVKAVEDLKKPNYVLAIKTEHAVIGGSANNSNSNNNTSSTQPKSKSKGKKSAAAVETTSQDDQMIEIVFITQTGLVKELNSMINDLPEELVDPLVEHFLKSLNVQYFDLLKDKIEKGLVSTSKSDASDNSDPKNKASAPAKKNKIKDVQEKVKLFLVNSRVFEKALKLFTDPKVQDNLSKHLIKTTFSEIINDMLKVIATEQMLSFSEDNFNNDTRSKLIQKLKEPHKQRFTELNQSLANKTSSEIIEGIEKLAVDSLELSIKKADSKREKEVILQMRESTKQSLENESNDAATVLHLTSTLLFYYSTGLILNSPGRCVPNILEFLQNEIKPEAYTKLIYFQNLIIENAGKNKSESGEPASIDQELINEIKSIGMNPKEHLKNPPKN